MNKPEGDMCSFNTKNEEVELKITDKAKDIHKHVLYKEFEQAYSLIYESVQFQEYISKIKSKITKSHFMKMKKEIIIDYFNYNEFGYFLYFKNKDLQLKE